MKQKIAVSGMTLVVLMLALMFSLTTPVSAWTSDDGVFDDFGPRVDNYILNMYSTTDLAFEALEAGVVDTVDWEVPAAFREDWEVPPYSDPDDPDYIKMAPVKSIGQREFDLCHREEIEAQSGYVSPTSYQKFRQALVHMTNKPEYVAEILLGDAEVLGTPIMPWTYWYNDACSDYYTFDLTLARAALDDAGFTEITDYGPVPGAPEGADDWRRHPVTGSAMQDIIMYLRSDDPYRLEAGNRLEIEMKRCGIPTYAYRVPVAGCYTPVFTDQNYHIYTGGWGLSVDPDYLYDLYGGHAINWPNYLYYNSTDFNEAAAGIKYATTEEEAKDAADDAQMIMTQEVCNIPLWTAVAQTAHRGYAAGDTNKKWNGFVNAEGVGLANGASYMNAHTEPNAHDTLKCGQKEYPLKLNIMRSEWTYEYSILLRCYDFLLSGDPYDFHDMRWLAYDWNVGSYINTDPESPAYGETCTLLTFNLERDIYWHDGEKFTAADVKFSIDYYKANQGWWWGNVMDVYEVTIVDDYTVEVKMEVLSFWALHWVALGVPMFPKHIWEGITGTAIDGDMPDPYLIGTGPWKYAGGEPGTEPGTGNLPAEYVKFEAFAPSSAGFFRHCPIKALGGIKILADNRHPVTNNPVDPIGAPMKRTVYASRKSDGTMIHPHIDYIRPLITVINLHSPMSGAWNGDFDLDETYDGTYGDSQTYSVLPQYLQTGEVVTNSFALFDISAYYTSGSTVVTMPPWVFDAVHDPDVPTGRYCSCTESGAMVKTFVGDLDANGVLNVYDIGVLNGGWYLRYRGGIYVGNADINGDASVGSLDAIEMGILLGEL